VLRRQVVQAWADRRRSPTRGARTPISEPLSERRVALITTAGIADRDGTSFDRQGEGEKPWCRHPSWRRLRDDVTEVDLPRLVSGGLP